MRVSVILFASVMNLTLIDAVVKEVALAKLSVRPIAVVEGFFDLCLVKNRGCAWGMLQGQVWPLAIFGIVAIAALIWKRKAVFDTAGVVWRAKFVSFLALAAEALLYSGILGNVIDRMMRGYVVDMFDFHWRSSHFPCFNLADSYITLAVFAMLFLSFLPRKPASGVART